MMKRTLLQIAGTMVAALLCLFALVAVTGMPNDQQNGFDRRWWPLVVRRQQAVVLPFVAERLFGEGDRLYVSAPAHRLVYAIDQQLQVVDTLRLQAPLNLRPPVSFFAAGGHIYLHAYNNGKVYTNTADSVKISDGPFLKSIQLSDSVVVIRGFREGGFQPVFKRINTHDHREVTTALLAEKADAGVSTDGILCSNAQRTRLYYIPYFQNGIYCMDSALQLRYQQHTIDTVFHSSIQVAMRDGGETQKWYAAAPRAKVNKRAFANDRLLFVESALRADNEQRDSFNLHPVLDTYDLEKGRYTGSFYLPVDKRKVLSYYVHGDTLYVLLKDQLAAFTITHL